MKKLFMVLLGGKAPGANVELHDVVFVVTDKIENAYADLKAKWFGNKTSVHLDSWMEVNQIDGFEVKLHPKSSESKLTSSQNKLYFVNVGAYPPNRLEEAHHYILLIGNSDSEVKARAIAMTPETEKQRHKDNLFLVDDVLKVEPEGFEIELVKTDKFQNNPIKSDYIPLK